MLDPTAPLRLRRSFLAGEYVGALTGLRGVAVLTIAFFHFTCLPQSNPWLGWLARALQSAWIATDLFFVLSGFFITGILLNTKSRADYYGRFYAARARRLLPAYWIFLAVVALLLPLFFDRPSLDLPPFEARLWFDFFFLSNLSSIALGWTSPGIAMLWSLAIEAQFYLVWPFVVHRSSTRQLFVLCIVLSVAALGFRLVGYAMGAPWRWGYLFTLCRADSLALGSLVALVMRGDLDSACVARLRRVAGAVFAVFSVVFVLDAILGSGKGGLGKQPLGNTGGALLCASALLRIMLSPSDAFVTRVLEGRFLGIVGTYSYGIYLYHSICVGLAVELGLVRDPFVVSESGSAALHQIGLYAAALGFAFAFGAASYHLVEKRFLSRRSRQLLGHMAG